MYKFLQWSWQLPRRLLIIVTPLLLMAAYILFTPTPSSIKAARLVVPRPVFYIPEVQVEPPTDTPEATDTPTATPTPGKEAPAATNTPFPILITQMRGRFFFNPTPDGVFKATTATPWVFEEQFPLIDFNPPISVGCTPVPYVNGNTHPFTDVVIGTPGGPCAYNQRAQYPVTGTPTWAAGDATPGANTLHNFQAVFTGDVYVPQAGNVTFHYYSDDGWIMAIGPNRANAQQQPVYVSGVFNPSPTPNVTPRSAFENYLIIGQYNRSTAPVLKLVTVAFPAAGYYPVEIDYTECCSDPLVLLLGSDAGDPVPPGPSATPSPTNTPTNTPTCMVPTPFSYPWLGTISPTVTAAPYQRSLYTNSIYVQATATPGSATPTPQGTPGVWWTAGYTAADKAIAGSRPQYGLAILDFGMPSYLIDQDSIRQ